MEFPCKSTLLQNERKQTDGSLLLEREQTDHSLAQARAAAEASADLKLRRDREQANSELLHARVESNVISGAGRKTSPSGGTLLATVEQEKFEALLSTERERADRTTEEERLKADGVIRQERDLKRSLVRELLVQEREQTDANLNDERKQTDVEVARVTSLLSTEIATHCRTRADLTTRDEFLAIVSHDLRNPIGAVLSCSEMLLEDGFYKELDPEAKHWLGFIKRNTETALSLISDILDLERFAGGKLSLNMESLSLFQVMRESVENFVYEAAAKNILLRMKMTDPTVLICCDGSRIKQVLSNLIGNALKFTPEGGSVIVDGEVVSDQIVISIRDSGPGIPQEKRESVFERFAQIGSKDRRGLGLGLYISKMLVEAHQGKIWVRSELGNGSTFCFSIPKSV